jgi:diketogulonate reductase-like aldo/keto reductase
MRARELGPTGVGVPVLGQGTWNLEREDRASAVRTLRAGLDLGLTHVDTAEMYGDGEVERLVGEALQGRRAEAFLVSKVLPDNADRRGTLRACERSLGRLRTDHLDLYLLHWMGPHPLEETFEAFEELVRLGRIRAWGVSNLDGRDLDRAAAIAGPGRIACDQVLYHLGERAVETRVLPRCEAHGIAMVAYSPFGAGDFPGAGHPGRRELDAVAAARGATARQVALAFLVRRGGTFAIPKAARLEHARENAGAGDLELAAEEVERLERAFPLRPRASLPML